MVSADELVELQEQKEEQKDFKLATVTELFEDGTAKIRFFGEDADSEKQYSFLASYNPEVNDTVLLVRFLDTYIILGKVLYDMEIEEIIDYVTIDMLNDTLGSYALKTDIEGFITAEYLDGYALSSDLTGFIKSSALTPYAKTVDVATKNHTHESLSSGSYSAGLNHTVNNARCFVPSSTNMRLGYTNSYRWNEMYSTVGAINTSDLRQKNNIERIPDIYKELFMDLKPIIYQMNDGDSGRFHVGLGAQDIEKSMCNIGMDSKDFAGFIKTPTLDENKKIIDYEYGLRYSEFIALNITMIQDLSKRVDELESIIKKGI